MIETIESNHVTEPGRQNTILLEARLEQLGYQCISDTCEKFTTLRFMPKEIKKNKEELVAPSTEQCFG